MSTLQSALLFALCLSRLEKKLLLWYITKEYLYLCKWNTTIVVFDSKELGSHFKDNETIPPNSMEICQSRKVGALFCSRRSGGSILPTVFMEVSEILTKYRVAPTTEGRKILNLPLRMMSSLVTWFHIIPKDRFPYSRENHLINKLHFQNVIFCLQKWLNLVEYPTNEGALLLC